MRRNIAKYMLDSLKQVLRPAFEDLGVVSKERSRLAARYLRGAGLEIGALQKPLRLPRGAQARYVDRFSTGGLYEHYPELLNKRIVGVDIVDDAESLLSVPDCSQDFLVANHFLEHTQNTFLTLTNFLRVLRPDGCLYMAIPDMRFTFDRDRHPTPLEHLTRDFKEGPEWSREAHYEEWVRVVHKLEGEWAEREKRRFMQMNYSIHFHAWTASDIVEFISYFNGVERRLYQVECLERVDAEVIVILRKL